MNIKRTMSFSLQYVYFCIPGRLLPEYFPKIFGPTENEPLDREATVTAFKKMTNEINTFLKQDGSKEVKLII